MGKIEVNKRFRFLLVAGLVAVLQTVLWGCATATPAADDPMASHVLRATTTPPGVPDSSTTLPATPESPFEEASVARDGRTPPVSGTVRALAPGLETVGDPLVIHAPEYETAWRTRSDSGLGSARESSVQQQPYTWRDGDRTMTVLLQPDLTATQDGEIGLRADTPGNTTRSDAGGKSASPVMPVFRSQSGVLMTLPGGVLLALDKSWDTDEIDAFFERNGIGADRVSGLGNIVNGFFVETSPGFPSLDLANSLAVQDGVRTSMPNWRQDLAAQ